MSPAKELFEVPVHTWLKPSTFLIFEKLAIKHETTIAVLLARLADQATQPRERTKGGNRMTPERLYRFKQLYAQGMSDNQIAKLLGFSGPAISYHRNKLGYPATHKKFGTE